MADVVFDVSTQFGKSFVVAFRLEDGVIAEALSSSALGNDFAIDNTLEVLDFSIYY
jgi:hypothetical protein